MSQTDTTDTVETIGALSAEVAECHEQIAQLQIRIEELAGQLAQREAVLRHADAQLDGRVQERTSELEAAYQALAQQTVTLQEQADLLNLTHDAIFVRDLDGTIHYWNAGATEMYGWTRQEALGQKTSQILRTVLPLPFEEIREELYKIGRWEGELIHTRRDGVSITVASRWAFQHREDGKPPLVLEINTDISEQKRAQEKVAYQAHLLRNINDAVIAVDANGIITSWNAAAERIYGWKAEEAIGRAGRDVLWPQTAGSPAVDLPGSLGEMDGWQGEVKACRRDGRIIWTEVSSIALRDEAGCISGFVGVSRDITARKQAEEALRASRQQMVAFSRRMVETSENERRAIARELHDGAGQVLTSLKISLGLLQRDSACPAPFIDRLEEMKGTIDTVMDDLRGLAMNLRPGLLDRLGLLPAVQQYAQTFKQQTGLNVQSVAEGFDDRRLSAEVETNVYRLVQETLTNVARHAHATQVGIVIEIRNEELILIIEDNGVGFDVEEALRKGHLGLVGMRERAEMMGGELTVESSIGAGTTILVEIPLAPDGKLSDSH